MFCPPICTRKLECPMNVTPIWPVLASTGVLEWPVRGVIAECRTSFENCLAFFLMVMFNIAACSLDASFARSDSATQFSSQITPYVLHCLTCVASLICNRQLILLRRGHLCALRF